MKHGMTHTRIYNIWVGIRQRCEREVHPSYRNYGGKGITVCGEWHEFIPFYKWAVENGYSDDLTIDRIDTNGNYEPSNCRWVTMKVQGNNKNTNHLIEYDGETYNIQTLCEKTGINRNTFYARLSHGWSVEDAVNKPIHPKKERRIIGMAISIKEASRILNGSPAWIRSLCERNLIGDAYSNGNKRMCYHIVPGQLAEYMRISQEELAKRLEEVRNG